MFQKTSKLEYTKDYDYNAWIENCNGKETLHSDASLAYELVLANAYYDIDICVQSQDKKQEEYVLDHLDCVKGDLWHYLMKSDKIIVIKNNDVIKAIKIIIKK